MGGFKPLQQEKWNALIMVVLPGICKYLQLQVSFGRYIFWFYLSCPSFQQSFFPLSIFASSSKISAQHK